MTADVILEDYKYVHGLWVNLFSIPKSLGKGWNIGNKGVRLFLTNGNTPKLSLMMGSGFNLNTLCQEHRN
jgi:hypothetical protein